MGRRTFPTDSGSGTAVTWGLLAGLSKMLVIPGVLALLASILIPAFFPPMALLLHPLRKAAIGLLVAGVAIAVVPHFLQRYGDVALLPTAIGLGVLALASIGLYLYRLWDQWTYLRRRREVQDKMLGATDPVERAQHQGALKALDRTYQPKVEREYRKKALTSSGGPSPSHSEVAASDFSSATPTDPNP